MWFLADPTYKAFLTWVKQHIQQAQIKAATKVNQELLLLYWQIGNQIVMIQKESEWGDKILDQLSSDLKEAYPWMKGFSVRNLKYMRRFAREYPHFTIGQEPLAQITRYHNIALLQKVKDPQQRLRYAQKAVENGWSRNMMVIHIERKLFEARWKAITNFSNTLPKPNSDLANSILKDPYNFDFLMLTGEAKEKELEEALVWRITQFLLELGAGFAYVGRQFHINVGGEDFYLDLLFYHLKLRCYVVIELKTTKFKPEYAGKLSFYTTAVDEEVKAPEDNPTIGILLCKGKNKVTAQYTLKNFNWPIGISDYQLEQAIPDDFQSQLPSIEDLEDKLQQIESEGE